MRIVLAFVLFSLIGPQKLAPITAVPSDNAILKFTEPPQELADFMGWPRWEMEGSVEIRDIEPDQTWFTSAVREYKFCEIYETSCELNLHYRVGVEVSPKLKFDRIVAHAILQRGERREEIIGWRRGWSTVSEFRILRNGQWIPLLEQRYLTSLICWHLQSIDPQGSELHYCPTE